MAWIFAVGGFAIGATISLIHMPRWARATVMGLAVVGSFIFLSVYPDPGLDGVGWAIIVGWGLLAFFFGFVPVAVMRALRRSGRREGGAL